ncbi:endonuclease/exonuclease/phosphatase family protein [Spirosoma luteolum]
MNQQLRSFSRLWLWVLALLCAQTAQAQVSLTSGNLTYTQDFNSLATTGTTNTWTNNTTIPGWVSTQTTYNANTGSSNSGALYSYGSSGSSERALGSVASASAAPQYGVIFTNNTGSAIASLQVSYTGEQWRNGGNTSAQKLTVSYATGTNLVIGATGTPVSALDFTTPTVGATAAALDGNASANRTAISGTITFPTPLAAGEQVLLKWSDANDTGNDHGVSVDDLTVTATLASNVPTVALSINQTTATENPAQTVTVTATASAPVSGNQTIDLSATGTATNGVDYFLGANGNATITILDGQTTGSITFTMINDQLVEGNETATLTMTNPSAGITLGTPLAQTITLIDDDAPSLVANPTTLSGFSTPQGTPSAVQTYALTANGLTADVTVTAPTGYQVSQDGTNFQDNLTVTQSGGSVNATISVRLAGTSIGTVNSTITNVSGSLSADVSVSGGVTSNSPYTPIATARTSVGQTVTIQGRVTVTNQLGSRQIYIQDETGGIVVYSGPTGTDLSTLVQIGDLVQARGPISIFNGFTEITSSAATTFTVVTGAGNVVPTPVAITPDQLPNYQGQLVTITNATITPVASTFVGGTNYTISAGGQSGTLRISANSPLAGAGQPANPVSVTGIADRFVSGATTPGTNGLQLQPRILADVPGATPAQDLTCTVGTTSALGTDQTLDIAAWNMEFFGADAGTIICPNGNLNYNDMGPTNEDLQQSNAVTVLGKLKADIVAVEEISDINRFAAAVAAIPGSYSYSCSNRFSYYFQNDCDQTPTGNPPTVFGPSSLAQKVCVIYNKATVTPVLEETKPLLDGNYNYPAANNWSSGRLPFLFVADATINGVTKRVHVVAIHAKSGSATADYNRRAQDIIDLKAALDANYPTANLVILGDYNDKLNGSIATGKQSSYQPFVTDAANYSPLTLPLENQGCSTFNSSASFIDHIIISNDLAPAYVSNSTYVLQPFSIPNYGNTTSDHNPVISRFDLTKLVTPTGSFAITGASVVNCQQVSATERSLTFTPQYTGTDGSAITFQVVNELAATTAAGPYTLRLYTDNATIQLRATQGATTSTFAYNWLAACTTTTPTNPPTGSFAITGASVVNCQQVSATERSLTFTPQYTGTDGSAIAFQVVNELAATTVAGPYTLRLYTDNATIQLRATQGATTSTFAYNWLAACTTTTPTNPPTGSFAITGASVVNCQQVSATERSLTFTPQYTGTDGSAITFQVVNELAATTAAGPYTLRLYTDNPTITLQATQGGTTSTFAYNWLAVCNTNGRVGIAESTEPLMIQVLGNPIHNGQLSVDVLGAQGQALEIRLTDSRGQVLDTFRSGQAEAVQHHTFDVSRQAAGMLLLRASTPTKAQLIKVIKVN